MAATIFCVICGKEGKSLYGGHVHRHTENGYETITARFCSKECWYKQPKLKCKGCYGEWFPIHGYDPAFGQLMYIDSSGFHSADS